MLSTPTVSVVIPARNEGPRVAETIGAITAVCESPGSIEVVIVDDGSLPDMRPDVSDLARRCPVRIILSRSHLGVGAARNLAVHHARGDIVFITDAHVRLSPSWDVEVGRHMMPRRILAATIREEGSDWRGFGCDVVVPYMGTRWKSAPPAPDPFVQVASSAGTILARSLFQRLGGYDEGMIHYGGFEPEFSVRAWRSGVEIVNCAGIEVSHRFKSAAERIARTTQARTAIIHNCLRFGVVHLPEQMILEMVRLHAMEHPDRIQHALRTVEDRGAWTRRQELAASLKYDFDWFVARLGVRDQLGEPLPAD